MFQAGSKTADFLPNRVFEEAGETFLQGGSPAATQVLNNKYVLGGVLTYADFSVSQEIPEFLSNQI